MRRFFVAIAVAGCAGPQVRPTDDPTCDATWEGLAQPALTTWCLPCHASTVVGEDRRGAPEGLDFDGWVRASAAAGAIADAVAPGPDPARMPPGGGMGDEERAGLVRWAGCGAPGPATTAPDPCAERVPFEGDAGPDGAVCAAGANAVTGSMTVSSPVSAGALGCVCEVDGDLVVRGEVGTLELPALWRIGGALRVEQAALDRLALPSLLQAGSVSLTDAQVVSLDLDRLTTVNGAFYVLRGAMAPTFAPQRLRDVTGAFALSGIGGITLVDLPRLETVGGDLVIDGLPALRQVIHTSDLVSVGGSLRLVRNPSLLEVEDFGFLVEVGGDVELGAGGSLRRIDALFDLQRIGGSLSVRDEPSLEAITGLFDLQQVGGAIRVVGTGAVAIDGLGALAQIGALEVASNPALVVWRWQAPEAVSGSVQVTASPLLGALPLAGLRAVGADLTVSSNATLTDLGAPDLQTVGGDLVIRDNAALPQAEVDDLLGRVTVGGTTTAEGNGP